METVFFKIEMPKELRTELKKQAVINDITMNSLAIKYIEEGLKSE